MAAGLHGSTASARQFVVSRVVEFIIVEVPVYIPITAAHEDSFKAHEAESCIELQDGPILESEAVEAPAHCEYLPVQVAPPPCGDDFSEEVEARVAVVRKVLSERLRAAFQRRAPELPGWLRAGRNVAMHNFEVSMVMAKARQFCALQRGGRKKKGKKKGTLEAGPTRVLSRACFLAVLLGLFAYLAFCGLRTGIRYEPDLKDDPQQWSAFDTADLVRDGSIRFHEFDIFVNKWVPGSDGAHDKIQVFKRFDSNEDGGLNVEEFADFLDATLEEEELG